MTRFDEEPDADPHGECAAEIHRLQAQVEALTAELESWRFTNRIDELQRAHDSYKKDAERYRFMRLQDGVTLNMSWAMPFPKNHIHGQPMSCHSSMHGNGEMLDKMVDATIAKGANHG